MSQRGENLQPLVSAIHRALEPLGLGYEVVITDDCSTDSSWSVLKELGAHRFLPTLIKMEGFRVVEVSVSTNPRFSGISHYGVWNRLFKSFRDLLGIRWMKSRRLRYQIAESVNASSRADVATCGQRLRQQDAIARPHEPR